MSRVSISVFNLGPVWGSGVPPRGVGTDSGISKSEVSQICADLDSEVSAFRDRSLTVPYVVDATY
jgi:hypothetical protein